MYIYIYKGVFFSVELVVLRHEVAVLAGVAAELLELIYRIGVMVRHHAVLAHVAEHLRRGAGV